MRGSKWQRGGAGLHAQLLLFLAIGLVSALVAFTVTSARAARQLEALTTLSGEQQAESAPWFEEQAVRAGLVFRHVATLGDQRWFPEIVCGGAGWLDHDGDGDLDLYLVQAGDLDTQEAARPGNRLYSNNGDGTFTDVTERAGVGDRSYGMGCACSDYDGDGDGDIYVTNFGPNVLYRNDGDGTFTDVTSIAGVGSSLWGLGAVFFDADRDGDLDLFVTNYVVWSRETELQCRNQLGERDYCNPRNYGAPASDVFYRNIGGGVFEDATVAFGFDRAYGNGMGVTAVDMNEDGWLDLYVANDGMPNQLWINETGERFVDRAMELGCSVNREGASEAGMGVTAFDLEGDTDVDLLITHLSQESNTCYVASDGVFEDRTLMLGVGAPSLRFTGFGLTLADLDLDGLQDIYIANGEVGLSPPYWDVEDRFAQPDLLLRGLTDGSFEEVPLRSAILPEPPVRTGRAVAAGDPDDDGDLDLVVVDRDRPVRFLRNLANPGRQWIGFELVDHEGHEPIGARVVVSSGDRSLVRICQRSASYLASNDPRVLFGLGAAGTAEEVTVLWPRGGRESFGALPAGRYHQLREGDGSK